MSKTKLVLKPILYGFLAGVTLLGLYFLILNFVSGWDFTLKEFDDNWYYIILLSFGFGLQIGLYMYLRCHPEFARLAAKRVSGSNNPVIPASSVIPAKAGIQKKTWIPNQVGNDNRQVQHDKNGKVVAVSGTTSTAAMISCCSHYLVNILPVLGVTGLVTFVSQYQTELFWVGIAANLAGVVYMGRKVVKIRVGVGRDRPANCP